GGCSCAVCPCGSARPGPNPGIHKINRGTHRNVGQGCPGGQHQTRVMLLPAVARGMVECCRWYPSPERPVIADIGLDTPFDRLTLGHDRRTVVSSPRSRSAANTWPSINP